MYERFTDRARKVMQLANQEAQRFNHEYIGTEHILLGLIKEGGGVAANVLKSFNIDLRKIRLEVEKLIQGGPDMMTMGKLPQTPRAKRVVQYAFEESQDLNSGYVGTEHIFIGLLREDEGVAAQVLMNLGLQLGNVRKNIMELLGNDPIVQSRKLEEVEQFPSSRLANAINEKFDHMMNLGATADIVKDIANILDESDQDAMKKIRKLFNR